MLALAGVKEALVGLARDIDSEREHLLPRLRSALMKLFNEVYEVARIIQLYGPLPVNAEMVIVRFIDAEIDRITREVVRIEASTGRGWLEVRFLTRSRILIKYMVGVKCIEELKITEKGSINSGTQDLLSIALTLVENEDVIKAAVARRKAEIQAKLALLRRIAEVIEAPSKREEKDRVAALASF